MMSTGPGSSVMLSGLSALMVSPQLIDNKAESCQILHFKIEHVKHL